MYSQRIPRVLLKFPSVTPPKKKHSESHQKFLQKQKCAYEPTPLLDVQQGGASKIASGKMGNSINHGSELD